MGPGYSALALKELGADLPCMISFPSGPSPLRPVLLQWICLATLLNGCAVAGTYPMPRPASEPESSPWTEVGVASWYGEPFHGRTTASGETFDMEAMTAAHPTLPFGTRLQVENLDNGRAVTVTVNDRGPFVKDRILDVSRRAAEKLGMLGPGTARVRITVLGSLGAA